MIKNRQFLTLYWFIIFFSFIQNLTAAPYDWIDLNPSNPPSPRRDQSMVFDSNNGKVILFGGLDSAGDALNDTWSYDIETNAWTDVSPPSSPSNRYGASMVFDPSNNQIVLFGGFYPAPPFFKADTWVLTYDNASNTYTWTDITPTLPISPPPRFQAGMSFLPTNERILLFGGFGGSALGDTWELSFNSGTNAYNWTQINPLGNPPARGGALLVFDPSSNNIILFGGYNSSNNLNDTWGLAFNSTTDSYTWTDLNAINPPSPRLRYAMDYDLILNQMILFSGQGEQNELLDDTYGLTFNSLTNTYTWANLNPINHPRARYLSSMVYQSNLNQMVLFGGQGNNEFLNDTWAFAALPFQTTLDLTVDSNAFLPNEAFVLTAILDSHLATGTITFFQGAVELGAVPVNNGVARLTTSFSQIGNYSITAVYSGDADFSPSTSNTVVIIISPFASPLPPQNLRGIQKKNEFATQTQYVNILSWNAPSDQAVIVAYQVYKGRNLNHLIGTVSSDHALRFKDQHGRHGITYYQVVSVDSLGNKSQPATVKVGSHKN